MQNLKDQTRDEDALLPLLGLQRQLITQKYKLLEEIENHDCHLSSEDGCQCIHTQATIAEIQWQLEEIKKKF